MLHRVSEISKAVCVDYFWQHSKDVWYISFDLHVSDPFTRVKLPKLEIQPIPNSHYNVSELTKGIAVCIGWSMVDPTIAFTEDSNIAWNNIVELQRRMAIIDAKIEAADLRSFNELTEVLAPHSPDLPTKAQLQEQKRKKKEQKYRAMQARNNKFLRK